MTSTTASQTDLRTAYDRDGYVVLRGVLSADEVAAARREAEAGLRTHSFAFALGSAMPPLHPHPTVLGGLMTDERVVSAVREVLGVDRPVLTRDAGLHRNVTSPWHKDDGRHLHTDGYYGVAEPEADPGCRIVRLGAYLQDHLDGSGLNVRTASHRVADLVTGPHVPLEIHAGDLVLCDVLTTHRGRLPSVRDRVLGKLLRPVPHGPRARVVAVVRRLLNRLTGRPDRIALFVAYGVPGRQTQTYSDRVHARDYGATGLVPREVDEAMLARLDAVGLDLAPLPGPTTPSA